MALSKKNIDDMAYLKLISDDCPSLMEAIEMMPYKLRSDLQLQAVKIAEEESDEAHRRIKVRGKALETHIREIYKQTANAIKSLGKSPTETPGEKNVASEDPWEAISNDLTSS